MAECGYCWGSHGCSLKPDHRGAHRCSTTVDGAEAPCCEYDEPQHLIRYCYLDTGKWSRWEPARTHGWWQ